MDFNTVVIIIISALVTFVLGYFLRKYLAEAKIISAEAEAKKIIDEANKGAEAKKREILLEAKEKC